MEMTTEQITDKTICGQCGKETADNIPVEYRTDWECKCAALVSVTAPVNEQQSEDPLDLPAFRSAFEVIAEEHKVKPGDERKLCDTCRKMGSTFGCLECNSGATNIHW